MDTKTLKAKNNPTEFRSHQKLISEANDQGAVKAKIILTKDIPLANWVKLQCQYGCEFYGKRFTCPPCSPTSDEMSEVLMDYQKAIIIQMDDSNKVLEAILNLEESLKKQGYYKAFGICALPCNLCEVCTIDTNCQHPEKARPTFQACGMDVPQIMAKLGWTNGKTITPCTDSHPMGMVLIH
ncbi:MAG: DUF2284 domain-containing protein [Nitrospinales bacterium]